jgi:Copper transport outer membrane protein, MctB
MINFRYHLVSLVAVFLALAIGIVAGSTVIKESILDQTQQNLDRAEKNLKDLEDTNTALRAELDQLNRRDQALDRAGVDFLQNRLVGVPVMLVKVDGVDDDAVTALRQAVDAAGAEYAGTVTLTDRLGLSAPADVGALQTVLGAATLDPNVLRADLAARLANLLTSVADSRPAIGARAAVNGSDPATTTTTLPPTGSMLASIKLRELLGDLHDAGFVKLGDRPDDADTADLAAMRLIVVSGAGAKVDNATFVYPFLQRMIGGAEPSTLAVEATKQGSEVERGSFVNAIRNDGSLSEHVSTVDDAEWFVGRAAAVMALQDLVNGTVGHYGVGEGASGLLPTAASTSRS